MPDNSSILLNSFYYSLTKFIESYHTNKLLSFLYQATTDECSVKLFVNELIRHIANVIASSDGSENKRKQCEALENLKRAILCFNFDEAIESKYRYPYWLNSVSFLYYLEEKEIECEDINLYIDNEDNTFNAMNKIEFNICEEVDSKSCPGVRISDHLCGFIGKMMRSLYIELQQNVADIDKIDIEEVNRLHKLSNKWFELSKEQFKLAKVVARVLSGNNKPYWMSFSLSYSDQMVLFFGYIQYIDTYQTYNKYRQTNNHEELGNAYILLKLRDQHETLKNPAFDFFD